MTDQELDKIPFADWPFKAKAAHWRTNGAPGVTYQQGQAQFHDTTIRQYADKQLTMAAAQGRTLVPCDANGEYR